MTEQIAPESTLPADSIAIRRVLGDHWIAAVVVMVLVLLAGIPFAMKKGKPTYSTTGVLYVAPHFVGILKDAKELDFSSYQQFRQFIEHQAITVTRYDILLAALERMGDRRWVWQLPDESPRRATQRLQAALSVVAVENSYLITVSLESNQREGLEEVVNSVIETFIEKSHDADSFFAHDRRVATLQEKRRQKVAEMGRRTQRRNDISRELGITLFSDSSTNPYDELLLVSEKALVDAKQALIQSESRLVTLQETTRGQGRSALAAAVYDDVQGDSGLASLRSGLYGWRSDLLKQIAGMKDSHPLAIQIQAELKEIEDELNKVTQGISERSQGNLLEKTQADVRRQRMIVDQVSRQIAELRTRAAGFAALYNEALDLTKDLDQGRKALDEMDNRIEFFEMESKAPGFMRIESLALSPDLPVKGGRKKLLLMVLLAAIGLGLVTPFVIEKLDRRLKTPGELMKILGQPPMGVLVDTETHAWADRFGHDQLRRVAMRLESEARQLRGRVVLLTSIKAQASVTPTVLNLSHELDEMGLKVLVIDANGLAPDARYASYKPQEEGLSHLLKNPALDPEKAIHRPWLNGVDSLSLGIPHGFHLPAIARLAEVLETLKNRYDLILVDGPPMLLSGDAETLVRLADISLLLVPSGQVYPAELKRTLAILEKLQPPMLGLLLTQYRTIPGSVFYRVVNELATAQNVPSDSPSHG